MEILVILLLILLNGLFAMSEIALISARKSNLTAQAKQGNKRARQALKLAEDPNKFLSTVQIDHDHIRRRHAVIRHAGGLDDHQAALPVDA